MLADPADEVQAGAAGGDRVVREAVEAGKLNATAAYSLARLPPEEQREKLAAALQAGEGVSGNAKKRAMRAAVNKMPGMRTKREIQEACALATGGTETVLKWVLGQNVEIDLQPRAQ